MKFFGFIVILLFALGCSPDTDRQPISQHTPHIVIILADDMGYGDLGSYNEFSRIPTPEIDRLAAEGMRFTDAHAPGTLCHPSRYGLMTGRYPFRTDVTVWPDKPVIEEGRMTLASLLQSQGYRTAMVGKWHLGFDESQTITPDSDTVTGPSEQAAFRIYEKNQQLPGGPVDRGFDSFFGIRASTDIPPYFYIRDDRVVNPPTERVEDNFSGGIWTDIQGAFWREGGIAPDLELIEVLPRFTEESVDLIRNHPVSHPAEPLFLYIAYPAPHTPWLPAESFVGVSEAGLYGDFMAMVDFNVGEILAALEESGMAENTLVIFTSDNGPVWYDKDKELFGHDSMGGFRGMKGDAFEGGHRMPFIARWPGVVGAGSVSDQTISFTDLMATFAEITAADLPVNAGEDSFSFLPVLNRLQPDSVFERPPVITTAGNGLKAIQDGEWKLINGLGSGGFTQPSRIQPGPDDPPGQLYNLHEDPAETTNLWHEYPLIRERLMEHLEAAERNGRTRP
ncbi:MAG: arylsulfatase [Balneolaceae bacterium]|nr:MAG: arylsulfatase [Balneolaceae bacterium]